MTHPRPYDIWKQSPTLSRRWRVAIVGAGHNAAQHARGLVPATGGVELAAIVEPDADRRRTFADQFDVARSFAGVEQLIDAEAADVALVSTPTSVRMPVCRPLFEARLPVFLEKPMCDLLDDAVELAGVADAAGCPLAINQNFRYFFPFASAAAVFASGRIGQPRHLVQRVLMKRDTDGWRAERGRNVMSVMSNHWFDGYRLMFGEPDAVYCQTTRSELVRGGGETATSVILTWPDGPIASLNESFSSLAGDAWDQLVCQIDGDAGSLTLISNGDLVIRDADGKTETLTDQIVDKPTSNRLGLVAFVHAIETGTTCPTHASDNLRTIAVMEAAYQSAQLNQPVCPASLLPNPIQPAPSEPAP